MKNLTILFITILSLTIEHYVGNIFIFAFIITFLYQALNVGINMIKGLTRAEASDVMLLNYMFIYEMITTLGLISWFVHSFYIDFYTSFNVATIIFFGVYSIMEYSNKELLVN